MIKLKVISFFLAMVMMVQMLPISQIGQMLSTNQWTEELPHNCEQSGKGDVNVHTTFLPPDQHQLVSMFMDESTLLFIHISEQIPNNHSTDILTPPPNNKT